MSLGIAALVTGYEFVQDFCHFVPSDEPHKLISSKRVKNVGGIVGQDLIGCKIRGLIWI